MRIRRGPATVSEDAARTTTGMAGKVKQPQSNTLHLQPGDYQTFCGGFLRRQRVCWTFGACLRPTICRRQERRSPVEARSWLARSQRSLSRRSLMPSLSQAAAGDDAASGAALIFLVGFVRPALHLLLTRHARFRAIELPMTQLKQLGRPCWRRVHQWPGCVRLQMPAADRERRTLRSGGARASRGRTKATSGSCRTVSTHGLHRSVDRAHRAPALLLERLRH